VLIFLALVFINSHFLRFGFSSSSQADNRLDEPIEIVKVESKEQKANEKSDSMISVDAKALEFYQLLSSSESQTYSQNREDGVIKAIMKSLGQTERGFFLEIGLVLEAESNTLLMKNKYNWMGLILDDNLENVKNNLHREFIEHDRVVNLLKKFSVAQEFELLSVDMDYSDYWMVEAILAASYRPKVIVHEVNQQEPHMCVTVPKPVEYVKWDQLSSFHGGSMCAFRCLAKRFKYTMVYCESAGVNCFWIRDDLLKEKLGFNIEIIQGMLTPKFLYKKLSFAYQSHAKTWEQVKCN
jgi:hypothetical protein